MSSVGNSPIDITSDTNSLIGDASALIQGAAIQQTTDTDANAITSSAASSSSSSAASTKASSTSVTTTASSSSSSAKPPTSTSSVSRETSTSGSSTSTTSTSKTITLGPTSITDASVSTRTSQTLSPTDSGDIKVAQVTNADGSLSTVTAIVSASTSSADNGQPTAQPQTQQLTSTTPFFKNKAAVGGVFGAVGFVSLIVLLAVILKIVRYRQNRRFEKELDEQVEQEARSGTPMFGFGKDDDGSSIMGGRAPGLSDPEKAYGGGNANQTGGGHGYGGGNTAAYATYGAAAAVQPAYYSPNSSGNAPRRYSPAGQLQFNRYNGGGGLARSDSGSSGRTYGSLNQPPMNAFVSSNTPAPRTNSPAFAPATFAGNYNQGEYRNGSPAPSAYSQTSYSAALTPGGRGSPAPGGAYTVERYGSSQGSSDGYGAFANGRPQVQIQTGLAVPRNERNSLSSSPNAPLPNPFDQRDQ